MWFILPGCHCGFKTKVILDVPTILCLNVTNVINIGNSFQSIEQLMKRSTGIPYGSIIHYKACWLSNLTASIFLSKQKGQKWQLRKPACELLIKKLNCTKAIRMLIFQSISFLVH